MARAESIRGQLERALGAALARAAVELPPEVASDEDLGCAAPPEGCP